MAGGRDRRLDDVDGTGQESQAQDGPPNKKSKQKERAAAD